MRNALAIARREVISYFYSPIAYIVLALFLFISGFFFFSALQWERGDLQGVFYPMGFVFFFFCPLITMRLMSEEMKMGTLETLMTAPVTDTQVIAGKFLAGMGFYIFLLLPTLLFPFMVSRIGQVQWGSVMAAYIGLVFLGCFYVSVGLLISCLTKNQIIAAVASFIVLLFLWILWWSANDASDGVLKQLMLYVTVFGHYSNFIQGLIDTRDAIFYLSATVFLLFLSVRILEARKWR